ncbi:MAG TPA: hypothetical protein VD772_10975, partial [Anseongella sp.]|nr:hypothetical protein [Anseongella sp.]
MVKRLLFLCCNTLISVCLAQPTPFELSEGTETATYAEVIAWYQALDEKYPAAKLLQAGGTDSGQPLHLFVLSR